MWWLERLEWSRSHLVTANGLTIVGKARQMIRAACSGSKHYMANGSHQMHPTTCYTAASQSERKTSQSVCSAASHEWSQAFMYCTLADHAVWLFPPGGGGGGCPEITGGVFGQEAHVRVPEAGHEVGIAPMKHIQVQLEAINELGPL